MKRTGVRGWVARTSRFIWRKTLAVALSAFLIAGTWPANLALATVPQKISYQGNLRQSGILVTGNKSMVFKLYSSSTSTSVLWTSPAYSVVIATGLFQVSLEPSIDWEGTNPWLEVAVEETTLSPREELTGPRPPR